MVVAQRCLVKLMQGAYEAEDELHIHPTAFTADAQQSVARSSVSRPHQAPCADLCCSSSGQSEAEPATGWEIRQIGPISAPPDANHRLQIGHSGSAHSRYIERREFEIQGPSGWSYSEMPARGTTGQP